MDIILASPVLTTRMEGYGEVLGEVREFVKERMDLEREFGRKLALLATKHTSRRPDGAEVGSCGSTWRRIVNDTNEAAKLHVHLADMMTRSLTDLKVLKSRNDRDRIQTHTFVTKVVAESRVDVATSRAAYFGSCEDVDAIKGAFGRTVGEKMRRKVRKAWHRSILDMNNAKNLYIMDLEMSNLVKKKNASEIPIVLAQVSEFGTNINRSLMSILREYLDSQKEILRGQLDVVDGSLYHLQSADPAKETEISFDPELLVPKLIEFEGCGLWTDNCKLVSDEYSVLFLRNNLSNLREELALIEQSISTKKFGIEGLEKLYLTYQSNPLLGCSDNVRGQITEESRSLFILQQRQFKHQSLIDISKVVGEFPENVVTHTFKTTLFLLPKWCGSCKQVIWGRAGRSCIEWYSRKRSFISPYNAHKKCEMKSNPSCSGLKNHRKALTLSRAVNFKEPIQPDNELVSFISPVDRVQEVNDVKTAQVIYDFTATGPGETSVKEGDYVIVTTEDDGSGWTLVATSEQSGVVPTYALQW